MNDTTESLRAEEPTEAWVVEVCVLGRERTGPWRVQFDNIKSQAEAHATEWNASRPAGYSHRVRRYVPEDAALARLEAAEGERREFLGMLDFAYHLRFVDDSNSQEQQYAFWVRVEDAIAELSGCAAQTTQETTP